jgi:hypothetical protein
MNPHASRPLYRPDELARTFAPRSIAVVGVSTNRASFGSITYANIAAPGRFAGPVYMVNAKYERIDEKPCYPSTPLPGTDACSSRSAMPGGGGRRMCPARRGRSGALLVRFR